MPTDPPSEQADPAEQMARAEQVEAAGDRRPWSVYGLGAEPDPRFSMANERTALAWVRTALATVAAGIGLTTVVRLASLPRGLELVSAVMCLIGALLSVSAVLGWRRREVALRTGRPLPAPVALPWLAAGIVLISTALAVVVAVGRR